jgi:hypothetical protein
MDQGAGRALHRKWLRCHTRGGKERKGRMRLRRTLLDFPFFLVVRYMIVPLEGQRRIIFCWYTENTEYW